MERCVTGQEKVYKAVQSLYEATLKAKQAMINLGVDVDKVVIEIGNEDFKYLVSIIELTNEHNFSKFYKRTSEMEFTFCGVKYQPQDILSIIW